MAINDLIILRRGTAAEWSAANPVLASGEPGYDLTNSVLKIGDGISNWVALSGIGSTSVGGSSSSSVGVRGVISTTGTLTSFAVSGGYPVGYLDLFQDGVKLVSDLDFSATDGSNVTLSNSVPSGTVLEYLTMASGVSAGGGALSGSVTIPASDPYWDSVLLLLRGDGNLTDSSKYGRTLTAYGNAAANAAGKYGTNSIALDGTGDYLSLSSSDFAWGTSDWTAEAWVWLTAYGNYGSYFSTYFSNGSPYGVSVGVTNTGYPFLMHPGGANIQGASLLPTGQWVHLAAVRANGVVAYYVNGTSVGSVTAADSHGQSNVVVGRTYVELDNNYWNGRIAELRVTKAARYAANFTPPTAALPTTFLQPSPQTLPVTITGSVGNSSGLSWSSVPASDTSSGTAGQIAYDDNYLYVATNTNIWKRTALSMWSPDPYFSSVSLLMHGDGNITDNSLYNHSITTYGASATGLAKFGTNSLNFTGSSSYLRVVGNSAFSLPADFTIESWIYLSSLPSVFSGAYGACILSTYPGAGANPGWQFRINGTSLGYDRINIYTGSTDLNWSYAFSLNIWYHVAITRSGSSIKVWVNGVQAGSTTTNSDDMSPSYNNDIWIGRLNLSGYEFQLAGRLDDIRITKGIARYNSTFTPPVSSFPNY